MDFIIFRHGETLANINKIYSTPKEPLSEKGVEGVINSSSKLKKYPYDRIYSSPYIRAVQTSEILNIDKKEIILDPNIREVSLGILEGKSFGEVFNENEASIQKWIDDPFMFGPEGGESLLDAYERAKKFLSSDYDGRNIFVSHEGFIRLCLCVAVGNIKSFFSFNIKNASITHIKRINGFYYIEGINL